MYLEKPLSDMISAKFVITVMLATNPKISGARSLAKIMFMIGTIALADNSPTMVHFIEDEALF